jgi:hypothetical protein
MSKAMIGTLVCSNKQPDRPNQVQPCTLHQQADDTMVPTGSHTRTAALGVRLPCYTLRCSQGSMCSQSGVVTTDAVIQSCQGLRDTAQLTSNPIGSAVHIVHCVLAAMMRLVQSRC